MDTTVSLIKKNVQQVRSSLLRLKPIVYETPVNSWLIVFQQRYQNVLMLHVSNLLYYVNAIAKF